MGLGADRIGRWQDRYVEGSGGERQTAEYGPRPALIQMARNIGEMYLGLPELDQEQSTNLIG